MRFEPLFSFFKASFLIDLVYDDHVLAVRRCGAVRDTARRTTPAVHRRSETRLVSHAVAALSIVHVVRVAARVRHAARLDPRIVRLALEVLILVPVVGDRDATAAQPVALYPVNEVLQVLVITVVGDHHRQILFDLVFYFVFVHEDQNAECEFGEEDYPQGKAELFTQ